MTTEGLIILIAVAVVVLIGSVGIGLALRGPVQRRLYAGTGLESCTTAAKRLPWSDRLHLARANDRGRAAKPELACAGAWRGRVMLAAIERQSTLTSMRWLYRVAILIPVLQLALNVWILTGDDTSRIAWVTLGVWPVAIALIAVQPWQQRRQRTKIQRSVKLNEALAAQQPGHPAPST